MAVVDLVGDAPLAVDVDQTGPLHWNLVPGLTGELHERMADGELDMAIVTDAPPGLPSDPRFERQFREFAGSQAGVPMPL